MPLRGAPFAFDHEPAARQDLERLSHSDQLRFIAALEIRALTGEGDVKAFQGVKDVFRLRIGQVRAECHVFHTDQQLLVIRVAHRQAGYGERARNHR
jgi:mRNA-degrading endonuclease RelE of RelBE toxin-antitoxin system